MSIKKVWEQTGSLPHLLMGAGAVNDSVGSSMPHLP